MRAENKRLTARSRLWVWSVAEATQARRHDPNSEPHIRGTF